MVKIGKFLFERINQYLVSGQIGVDFAVRASDEKEQGFQKFWQVDPCGSKPNQDKIILLVIQALDLLTCLTKDIAQAFRAQLLS